MKQIKEDLTGHTATRTSEVSETGRHPRHCEDADCVLCEFANYHADPHCSNCKGFGFVHPTKQILPTPEGDLRIADYSRLIVCPAPGCMKETLAKENTGTYDAFKGVSRLQTLNNFNVVQGSKPSWDASNRLLLDPPEKPLLYIYGDMGCGKTHLCNGVALVLAQVGKKVKLWRMDALLDWLREGVGNDSLFARTTELKELDALVIDDFESAKLVVEKGQWALEKMEEIIDHRYHARKITMLTSNENYSKLPEKILDRFKDKTTSLCVWNEAGNYRTRKKK